MLKKLTPGQLIVLSYGAVGLVGTFLLMLPWATTATPNLLQALFTATSALTATGLTVVPTFSHWTLFGKIVILIIMQIGGLGLMVLTTTFLMVLGLRVQLGQRVLIAQDQNTFNVTGVLRLAKSVVTLALTIELIGALLIALLTPDLWENGFGEGVMVTVFHAVSAFNGVGMDLTGMSLEHYRYMPALYVVYIVLILLGSLGYVVLQEIFVRRPRRKSLHTRLVLWVTALITVFGSAYYFLAEYNHLLAGQSFSGKLSESLFQAATRTAGFTTVPVNSWGEPFIFLMIIMMFIGASPGSVGGGIKTTTFGTVMLAVLAIARGKKEVVIWEREIATESVTKAFTVVVIAFMLVSLGTLSIMTIDKLPFLPVLFEVVSALATVGLSMGITPELSPLGQLIIITLMFVGRIGVLSLVIFLAKKEKRRLRYMKEDILIG